MSSRTLYYLENSRAFRAAWTLEELGLPYELKHYRRIEGKKAEPALKQDSQNPLGKSPFLVDDDVQLGESITIVRYLIDKYGPQRGKEALLGQGAAQRAEIDSWLSFSEGMMIHTLAAIYPRWFADPTTASTIETGITANIHNNLNHVERTLTHRSFLVGDRLTAADIACCFSVEYTFGMDVGLSSADKRAQDWPNTVAWLHRLSQTASYRSVLDKGVTHKFTLAASS